jgi:hypothetical protein
MLISMSYLKARNIKQAFPEPSRILSRAYVSHSDGSYERTGRPGVITEQFCLGMPTEAAYLTEIELVNAISLMLWGI